MLRVLLLSSAFALGTLAAPAAAQTAAPPLPSTLAYGGAYGLGSPVRGAYAPVAPVATRSNRVHFVGLALGGAGVVGGAVLFLGTILVNAFCFGRSSCSDPGMAVVGVVLLPVGGVAMIASGIALAADRVPVEPRVRAGIGPDGASLGLELAF